MIEVEKSHRSEGLVIAIGLIVAVVTGIVAGMLQSVDAQSLLYAVSSVGWVVATAILALRHAARGQRLVSAGFLILTIAETLLWVSGRPGDPGYEAGFAGGTMFYVPGLALIGVSAAYPMVVRLFASAGATVWAIASAMFLTGSGFSSTDTLAFAGYVLLSAAFVGVAVVVLRQREASTTRISATPSMIPSE